MKTSRYLFGIIGVLAVANLIFVFAADERQNPRSPLLESLGTAIPSLIIIVSLFGYVAALYYERRVARLENKNAARSLP